MFVPVMRASGNVAFINLDKGIVYLHKSDSTEVFKYLVDNCEVNYAQGVRYKQFKDSLGTNFYTISRKRKETFGYDVVHGYIVSRKNEVCLILTMSSSKLGKGLFYGKDKFGAYRSDNSVDDFKELSKIFKGSIYFECGNNIELIPSNTKDMVDYVAKRCKPCDLSVREKFINSSTLRNNFKFFTDNNDSIKHDNATVEIVNTLDVDCSSGEVNIGTDENEGSNSKNEEINSEKSDETVNEKIDEKIEEKNSGSETVENDSEALENFEDAVDKISSNKQEKEAVEENIGADSAERSAVYSDVDSIIKDVRVAVEEVRTICKAVDDRINTNITTDEVYAEYGKVLLKLSRCKEENTMLKNKLRQYENGNLIGKDAKTLEDIFLSMQEQGNELNLTEESYKKYKISWLKLFYSSSDASVKSGIAFISANGKEGLLVILDEENKKGILTVLSKYSTFDKVNNPELLDALRLIYKTLDKSEFIKTAIESINVLEFKQQRG